MNKRAFLLILLLLTIALTSSACAHCPHKYNGGQGAGSAMGEYTGRLDGSNAQSRRQQPEETRQYRGGPGDGSAMGEYAGSIDKEQ